MTQVTEPGPRSFTITIGSRNPATESKTTIWVTKTRFSGVQQFCLRQRETKRGTGTETREDRGRGETEGGWTGTETGAGGGETGARKDREETGPWGGEGESGRLEQRLQ